MTDGTRASKISQLRRELSRVSDDAVAPWVVTGEPEYQELVRTFGDQDMPDEHVLDYALLSSHWEISLAAIAGLRQRAAARVTAPADERWVAARALWARVEFLHDFTIAETLQLIASAALNPRRPLWVLAMQNRLTSNVTHSVHAACSRYLALLDDHTLPPLGDSDFELFRRLPTASREQLREFMDGLPHLMARQLVRELEEKLDVVSESSQEPPGKASHPPQSAPPPAEQGFFEKVGRFWSVLDTQEGLARAKWEERLDLAERAVCGTEPRSVLIVGERLVGKTAFLKVLAQRVGEKGWRVFEVGSSDLLADNIYIGQTEGLLRQARKELHASNKIAWYVTDISSFAEGGSFRHNPATFLDQLTPALTSGALVLWGEATAQEAERLFRRRSALRHFVEVVRLEPDDPKDALALIRNVSSALERDLRLAVGSDLCQQSVGLAMHHLRTATLPGSAIALLRDACRLAARAHETRVMERHVFDALARVAGLPRELVDGSEQLDVATVTDFFSKRVIGQPEAVRTIVERITMIKAGLNDPKRPLGVFLLAGPTGTGKTELAKATAEYLFGTADRLIRLDMSEFQTPESLSKVIGGPYQPAHSETLLDRIRQQPYSVVLLDEFEKAHWQVWDLCLQLLDEGRLTDYHGNTADFRSTLIILTTNLGATRQHAPHLGFHQIHRPNREDQVLQAISGVFRPEFQNRLDRIVAFQPLTRELMRGILAKELDRLYERPGLRRRDWAIEWEASAIEFLLERGFNPDMGARPLKRAIDQYVAAPLAAAIVEHRTPVGDQFVFMRSDGNGIQAEFIDPGQDDHDARLPTPEALSANSTAAQIALAPKGELGEVATLAAEQEEIARQLSSDEWVERKSRLTAKINLPAFWEREDRVQILSQLEIMDRLAVAAETAASLQGRLRGRRTPSGGPLRDVLRRLALQLLSVQHGLQDLNENAPVEVALAIEPALEAPGESGASRAWCDELHGMYAAWSLNRQMKRGDGPSLTPGAPPVLTVSGFGAFRTLLPEAGLHVLETRGAPGKSMRVSARVLVVPVPHSVAAATLSKDAFEKAFADRLRSRTVVRRYRRIPSPLVRGRDGRWRTGKLDAVMGGNFDLFEALAPRA